MQPMTTVVIMKWGISKMKRPPLSRSHIRIRNIRIWIHEAKFEPDIQQSQEIVWLMVTIELSPPIFHTLCMIWQSSNLTSSILKRLFG